MQNVYTQNFKANFPRSRFFCAKKNNNVSTKHASGRCNGDCSTRYSKSLNKFMDQTKERILFKRKNKWHQTNSPVIFVKEKEKSVDVELMQEMLK